MDRFENSMILYRPVALQELALIYDSGMKAFPARLPQQPIFYPVLDLEYARQTASDWNAKNGQLAGYVTEFKVEDQYISQFEKHMIRGSQHEEFWIPAEEMDEFNGHILGHIKVVEAHFGDAFQGFVPEKFGLQGKNAVEQFTLLANSYLYKRMDFYLEIKRNHKAVFLNYPFWQKHDFKNAGLKEKIIKAIKEAWFTSFPKIPLPNPIQEETALSKQPESPSSEKPVLEDIKPAKPINSPTLIKPVHENLKSGKPTDPHSLIKPLHEEIRTARQIHTPAPADPVQEEITPGEQTDSNEQDLADSVEEETLPDLPVLAGPVDEKIPPAEQAPPHVSLNHVHEETSLPTQTHSHFAHGITLGLRGEYREAIDELSKAVEEDPGDVVAHSSLGVVFHRLGEDERALASYETALKIDPIYAEAHYFRANILYSHGNVREAIAGYAIAVGLKPELIEAHQKPSPQDRLTDYTGSPAEMVWIAKPANRILQLNKLLESNRGQGNLFKERAAQYYRLRNYAQAIADYSSSLAIQPNDAGALHSRGLAYEQLGQHDRALQDYQQAIAINPQLSNIYINRGVTFGNMGNFRQSIASLSEAIRLAPKNPNGYFNRGMAYFQQGNFERAMEDFSNAIRLSPTDVEAYYWRGMSSEAAGRQQEAIADYRQFLAISQNSQARTEIEQKLSKWNVSKQDSVSSESVVPVDRQKTIQAASEKADQKFDLYDLVLALGERALNSTWFGSDVNCRGEKAEELYAFTDEDRPIEGTHLLNIALGIRQTIEGDFQAFDPGTNSPWIFIRAWEGSGFYLETNEPQVKKRLKTHFQSMEEVEGASPPYEGLFIRI